MALAKVGTLGQLKGFPFAICSERKIGDPQG